jgi:hypothetical protein
VGFAYLRGEKMRRLALFCFLVMVFGLETARAQQYEVAPSGTKAFTTHEGLAPGGSISLDIYLTGAGAPQHAGGVWIDFSASTDVLAYVDAGIASPPWDPPGPMITPFPPGIVWIVVRSVAGVPGDGDGDIPIAGITFQNTGPGDATVAFTTIPGVPTWSPLNDEDIVPGSLVISQVCDCTTDADCDDGIFCNGAEICDTPNCMCLMGVDPCDDGDRCTLDCDEDGDTCLTGVCDTSVLGSSADPCCTSPACLDAPICLDNDTDGDGIVNISDNCPNDYNPAQEDTYPPGGNGIGNACDCEADFDCNGTVDATDVASFLADFGRSSFFNPCSNADPCDGDFDCNVNVDAADVTVFLTDFGRNQFNNPCPACQAGDWCVPYPLPLTGVEGRVYYSTTPLPGIKVSLLDGSTQEEIIYTYSDENGNYALVYDTPGYYCLHSDPPSSEYASIAYCASWFIQEGEMTPFDIYLPKKLTLTSPPHQGTISDPTPALVWEADPTAVQYALYVEDLGSQAVVVSQDGITGTSYTVPDPLAPGAYYWSVLGYDAADHLVAFGAAQFTIE